MTNDVTIGIPFYRAEKYIKDCLYSALTQSYPYINILAIDDASDDKSADIVAQIQAEHPRGYIIRLIRHPKNVGIGETRNHLLAEAKTKYFFFLDADDTISENAIQLLHDAAEQNRAEMVYGSHQKIDMTVDTHPVSSFVYERKNFLKIDEFPVYVYRKYEGIQAPIWNILIDMEWFRGIGLRFLPINYWEDFALTMDLATYASRVVLLSDVTYTYFRHVGSLSNAESTHNIAKATILDTINAIAQVKENSGRIQHKSYFPDRMVKVMMTDFYIVSHVLKNKEKIHPSFSKQELRDVMRSPLTFSETLRLRNKKNLFLYLLGVLPPSFSIGMISLLGRLRKI